MRMKTISNQKKIAITIAITITIINTLQIIDSATIFHNSPVIADNNNIIKSDVSNSLSVNKIIIWFCAGVLGYAAIYTIGKNIAEK